MLEPREKGMVATTLHYAYEIRNAAEYFDDIPDMKLPGEMIELAQHILETKVGHFDPSEFGDRYETAVVEMLKRKQAGMPIERQPEAAAPTNVVNLMVALRRSVEAEKPATARVKASERKKTAKEPERRVCHSYTENQRLWDTVQMLAVDDLDELLDAPALLGIVDAGGPGQTLSESIR